ncbi:MAG: hypothetical protein ABH859_08280 [Pseudomonadota bacterium]
MPPINFHKDQLSQAKEVSSRSQETHVEQDESNRVHAVGSFMLTGVYGYPDRWAGLMYGDLGLNIDLSTNWRLNGSMAVLVFNQDNMLAPQQSYSLAYILSGSGASFSLPLRLQLGLNYLFRRRQPNEARTAPEGNLQILGGIISQNYNSVNPALRGDRNFVDAAPPAAQGPNISGFGINIQVPFLNRRLILNSQATIGAATYVNLFNAESNSNSFLVGNGMFGYYLGVTGILHQGSNLSLNLGLGGHEMLEEQERELSDFNFIGALHVHLWRFDIDVAYRYARVNRPLQPYTASRHSFAASLALPWQINERINLTSFITGFYLNESGRVYYGGQPTADGGCASIMCGEGLHLNLGETIGGADLGLRLGIGNFFIQADAYFGSSDIGGVRISAGGNWR